MALVNTTTGKAAAATTTANVPISDRLGFGDAVRLRLGILSQHLREYCLFDSRVTKRLVALTVLVVARVFRLTGLRLRALQLEASVHRSDWSDTASRFVERVVSQELAAGAPFPPLIREYIDTLGPCWRTTRFFAEPQRVLGTRILAVKPYRPDEKGVLIVDYSFAFPILAKFYDLEAIAARYHLVLEPSWSGSCDLDILVFARLGVPVFVQTSEPRDAEFLRRVTPDLVPVPIAANWWTDPNLMRPIPSTTRDIDVVMVASWARFKRHARFFAALRALQRRGIVLSTSLVGYPAEVQREDILALARHYGVQSQLEVHEWLTPEQVNEQFNRAKVNLIWSRREGFNRAVIEGLFAGVPCVMRTNFNYGHHYDYINEQTGCFSTEEGLPDTLLRVAENYSRYRTREWAMAHISPHKATAVLTDTIQKSCIARGERWTTDMAIKIGTLNTMRYLDPQEAPKFEDDYRFLASVMRGQDA
jgi:glycosyltransferase involved in cell wall biosynthesis